jgi:8-oxo-dGTP diphosphatase
VRPWRRGVRALVLDPAGRTVLLRFRDDVWACPGGGVDVGESDEEALRRELSEELGLDDPPIGPCIWTREHEWPDLRRHRGQRERIHVVRVPPFEPRPRLDLAAEGVDEVRWWTPEELERSTATFAPRELPRLIRALVEHGPPSEPTPVT